MSSRFYLLFSFGLMSAAIGAVACSGAQQAGAVSAVPALVECVYQQIDTCIQAKTPWDVCTAQVAQTCGADVATVVSIWASKSAAEAREGDAGSYPADANALRAYRPNPAARP